MTEAPRFQFTTSLVPVKYDEIYVPRLFTPWAHVLLDAIALAPGETVVDVATGPGTVARLAAKRLGARGRVIGADISRPMLDVARAKSAGLDAAPIEYVESPAAPLAVPDAVADAVVCQQGLQFFPDRAAALGEMRRVLKPDGRLGVAVWGKLHRCELFAALHAALTETVPADVASLITLPFGWPDPDELEHAIVAAGFRAPRVEVRELPLVFEGGTPQAIDSLWGTPLGPTLTALGGETLKRLNAATTRHLTPFIKGVAVKGQVVANIAVARA
jgi:ubiquinone/menaquinone biosynthesis C-methylase UbiE